MSNAAAGIRRHEVLDYSVKSSQTVGKGMAICDLVRYAKSDETGHSYLRQCP